MTTIVCPHCGGLVELHGDHNPPDNAATTPDQDRQAVIDATHKHRLEALGKTIQQR